MNLNATAIQRRDPLRAQLSAAVEQYLANGGRIHRLGHTEHAPMRPATYNNRPPRMSRRERERVEGMVAEHARAYAALGLTAAQASSRLRKEWTGRYVVTSLRLEQLAAVHGLAFAEPNGKEYDQ